MAKKISQLTQATEVKSDDVTVIVQDGETKKLPLNMMVTKQDIENKKVAGLAKLDEIEATYENDTYTPTITVKNKSSVKVGEGDGVDYSANVMDGHAKSAILKGCTLVNLITNSSSNEIINVNKQSDGFIVKSLNMEAKINYLIPTFELSTQYTLVFNSSHDFELYIGYDSFSSNSWLSFNVKKGINKIILNSLSTNPYSNRNLLMNFVPTELIEITELMLLKGDYATQEISYFEGMTSVKVPVLTTTGKNLADFSKNLTVPFGEKEISNNQLRLYSEIAPVLWNTITTYNFHCEVGEQISIQFKINKNENGKFSASVYDGNTLKRTTTLNTGTVNGESKVSFVATTNNIKIEICPTYGNDYSLPYDVTIYDFQIEKGGMTQYEPYKSNILTVNEGVELRGVGDVQDTLDCLTGELTERIGEIVLDGSEVIETYSQNDETYTSFIVFNVFSENKINATKWTSTNSFIFNSFSTTHLYIKSVPHSLIGTNKDMSITERVNCFKNFITNNPIEIFYTLDKSAVKTVDLMPSGTHPSTTPYCWKNGHIQLSSSGLLPNLEYSVVTSRAGQINQNATMIVKNDKRIFDLEILLAGGLVNTTYQALTLQNQVETGLSKVSLNSETEPDYLLYHMIMKLIEEKAYKLDDLTEKVSVFYLYEKLSDEQFETIYSALYPFVEDEIVEEPVVEELPEVVEDEVIM